MKSILASLLVVLTLFGAQPFPAYSAVSARQTEVNEENWRRLQVGDVCVSAIVCTPEKDAPVALLLAAERQVAPRETDRSLVQPLPAGFAEGFFHADPAAAHPPFGDISSPPPRTHS